MKKNWIKEFNENSEYDEIVLREMVDKVSDVVDAAYEKIKGNTKKNSLMNFMI